MNSQRCGIAKKKRRYPVNDIVSCPAICKIYKDTFRVLRVFRNQQKQRFEIAVVSPMKNHLAQFRMFSIPIPNPRRCCCHNPSVCPDNAPPVLKARTFQKATPDDLKRLCLYVSEILNNRLLSFLRYKRHWLVGKTPSRYFPSLGCNHLPPKNRKPEARRRTFGPYPTDQIPAPGLFVPGPHHRQLPQHAAKSKTFSRISKGTARLPDKRDCGPGPPPSRGLLPN